MHKKKYTPEECEQLEELYYSRFKKYPPTPIGFSIYPIIDLVEKAIERGEPLTFEECEKRFRYKKDENIVY